MREVVEEKSVGHKNYIKAKIDVYVVLDLCGGHTGLWEEGLILQWLESFHVC